MGTELDARLATAFGVELETSALLPRDDADAGAFLSAAERIGRAIVDRGASAPPVVERRWPALPARLDVASSPRERAAAIERQSAWAQAAGASWDGIEFHVNARGDALVLASRKLAPGERILTLPRRLMIIDNELADSTTGEPSRAISASNTSAVCWPRTCRTVSSMWSAAFSLISQPLTGSPASAARGSRARSR